MQRLFSCLAGFTFHEIKNNDLPESSSDHTSISTHLKEWCDLLRIFLHPLPYFPCKINKEIHCNFFWKSTFYHPESNKKHNGTISKTKEQMDYMSTVTGHLATREVASPPTNSPPTSWTSWWRDDRKPRQQRQSKKTNNDIQDKFNRGHN